MSTHAANGRKWSMYRCAPRMMSHARLKARCSQVRESLGLRLESLTKAAEDGQRVGEGEEGKRSMQRVARKPQRHHAPRSD